MPKLLVPFLSLLFCHSLVAVVHAQTAAPTQTGTLAPSQTVASAEQSPTNALESLIAGAKSLITSVYPSTTITNVAGLSWPSAVIIDGQTVSIPQSATATGSSITSSPSAAIPTSTTATQSQPSGNGNRNIAIVLGVIFGILGLALIAGLIWFIRRRRASGKGFRFGRTATPLDDTEIESWRQPSAMQSPETTQFPEKYRRRAAPPPPSHGMDPSRTLVALNDDPFSDPRYQYQPQYGNNDYGPHEMYESRSARPLDHRSSGSPAAGHKQSRSTVSVDDRPPTPFGLFTMQPAELPPNAPWVPPRSPHRPSSASHVHIPSVSETSDFDFGFQLPSARHSN